MYVNNKIASELEPTIRHVLDHPDPKNLYKKD